MKKEKKLINLDFLNFEIFPNTESSTFHIKENRNKDIVVASKSISEEEMNFLDQVIKAVGKKIDTDVFVIKNLNLIPYKQLTDLLSFKKLLVFGMQPKEIGLQVSINPYQIFSFDKRLILFCHSLNDISRDNNKKKQLWEKLQIMFN
ncbi:MAG: hypothetical protein MK207_10250 [Saprospiraceae bacterium]|nr:hypothetical protein [Saprospiraceae bacterium]